MIDQRPPKGPLFAEGAGRAKRGLGADEGIGPYKHERSAAEDRGATIPQVAYGDSSLYTREPLAAAGDTIFVTGG